MRPSKSNKQRKPCECNQVQYVPSDWIYTDSPFSVKQHKAYQIEGRPMEFYKTLVCSCGKEVGEVQFSGTEPGKWRILDDKLIPEEKLNKFRDFVQLEIFKELQPTLQKMGKIEKAVFFSALMYQKMK